MYTYFSNEYFFENTQNFIYNGKCEGKSECVRKYMKQIKEQVIQEKIFLNEWMNEYVTEMKGTNPTNDFTFHALQSQSG